MLLSAFTKRFLAVLRAVGAWFAGLFRRRSPWEGSARSTSAGRQKAPRVPGPAARSSAARRAEPLRTRTARKPRAVARRAGTSRGTDAPARGFRAWRRERPFVGSILVIVSGIELFFSGQLDLGNIRLQFGIEGAQATILPIALTALGVLLMLQPAQRIFYGIIALVIALYSIIGVNLGGWIIGMLLGAVGGIIAVSWMPREAQAVREEGSTGGGAVEDAGGAADASAEAPPFSSAPSRNGADPEPAAALTARAPGGTASAGSAGSKRSSSRPATQRAARGRVPRHPMIAVGAALALSVSGIGAAPATASQGMCLLGFLGDCAAPAPSPAPSASTGGGASTAPSSGSGASSGGSTGTGSSGSGSTGASTGSSGTGSSGAGGAVSPLLPPITVNTPSNDGSNAPNPDGGPTVNPLETGIVIPLSQGVPAGTQLTNMSGALKAQTLSISGLHGLGLVNVPTPGGGHQAIEIDCDDLVIGGFSLAVAQNGSTLSNVADRMELKGHVQVFLTSVTADIGGVLASFDLLHPPAQDANLSLLSGVTLGLNGVISDQILFTDLAQSIR